MTKASCHVQTARNPITMRSAFQVWIPLACEPRCKVCRASLDAVRTALARPANAAARPVGALALEVRNMGPGYILHAVTRQHSRRHAADDQAASGRHRVVVRCTRERG